MKKYNSQLFLIGFVMNIVRKFPLLLAALICAIVGIWSRQFLYAGAVILVVVLVWSLVQQIQIKHAVEHNDNPNFTPFAEAMMSDDWRKNIGAIIDDKINDSDDEPENK